MASSLSHRPKTSSIYQDLHLNFLLHSGFSGLSNRNPTPYTYAQAVKSHLPNRIQERKPNSFWINSRKGKKFCFRCGDLNHLTNSCRDSVRCFAYGSFGHKSKGCRKNLVSVNNSISLSDTSSIPINHGFQFVLKFLKLRGVLLDKHWFREDEDIRYLDELLYHFNNINEPKIGKGYRDRFGNPEEFFGKASSGVFKKQIDARNSDH